MNTVIEINKLRIYAYHGLLPQERVVGNTFEVSVRLRYPFEEAARNDTIHTTIDYSDVVAIVQRVVAQPSALLENVAWRIRKALTDNYPNIISGSIRVAKLTPPLSVEVAYVAALIEW